MNRCFLPVSAALLLAACTQTGDASPAAERMALEREAETAVLLMKDKDPSLQWFFDSCAGYVMFPDVGKGGLIVGAAHGNGVLYEDGQVTGHASLTQGSVGLQVGGQAFSELLFFEDQATLDRFKRGDSFELSAQASAVAVDAGAAAKSKYRNGVAIFIRVKGGLMAELSVAGQRLIYKPRT